MVVLLPNARGATGMVVRIDHGGSTIRHLRVVLLPLLTLGLPVLPFATMLLPSIPADLG